MEDFLEEPMLFLLDFLICKVNQVVSTLSIKMQEVWKLNGTQHRNESRSSTPITSKMKSSLMLQGS